MLIRAMGKATLCGAAALAFAPLAANAEPNAFTSLQYDAWPTPNSIRTQTGAPGRDYWQQKVDYDIAVRLDERSRVIHGEETVRYFNASPDTLTFVWFAFDQNRMTKDSIAERARAVGAKPLTSNEIQRERVYSHYDGLMKVEAMTDGRGTPLPWTMTDTFARVDLARPLRYGETATFKVRWSYTLVEGKPSGNNRTGYDCPNPEEAGSCIYSVAQWFPRIAAYSDYKGWHLNPFLGFGSFALELGDYRVAITVPAGHVVSASGDLTNASDVLTPAQNARLYASRQSAQVESIVSAVEAEAARSAVGGKDKTWIFKADNVRDFAWATSRSYLWDTATRSDIGEKPVSVMAFYPIEAASTWRPITLKAIGHALATSERLLFRYPYASMRAAYTPAAGGFEFPGLVFVGDGPPSGRLDGAPAATVADLDELAGVLFHEVGHSFFPIVVNSDEREWTWLDEGLNSFLQAQAEKGWRVGKTVRGNPAAVGRALATQPHGSPMDRPDSLVNFRLDGYDRPAAALEVLRSTVLGAKLFDDAFRAYGEHWKFKRPTAFDFFRTIQAVSGKDLDWFWRGWFYGSGYVDLALDKVSVVSPSADGAGNQSESTKTLVAEYATQTRVQDDAQLRNAYENAAAAPAVERPERIATLPGEIFYRLDIRNVGGVVMPITLDFEDEQGVHERVAIDAQVWRQNDRQISWLYRAMKHVRKITIDPDGQTGDADMTNNSVVVGQ